MSEKNPTEYERGFADGCNEGYQDGVRDGIRAHQEAAVAGKGEAPAARNPVGTSRGGPTPDKGPDQSSVSFACSVDSSSNDAAANLPVPPVGEVTP